MANSHPLTLIESIERKVDEKPDAIAFFLETPNGWISRTHHEYYRDILGVATALSEQGIEKGSCIAILARPCYQWEVADKAIMYVGDITVGLDPKSTGHDLDYIIENADVCGLFVENHELLEMLSPQSRDRFVFVCLFDNSVTTDNCSHNFDSLMRTAPAPALSCRAHPEGLAAIIFTSGTTGRPKGIPLCHCQLTMGFPVMGEAFATEFRRGHHKTLIWVPLSNGTGRLISSLNYQLDVAQYFVKDPLTLFGKIKEVNPTFLVVVPRLLEKVYAEICKKLREKPFAAFVVNSLLALRARFPLPILLTITDHLLLGKLRRAVWGAEMRFLISGSAPVDPRILRFFDALGVPTYEVYGASEAAMLMTMNRPGAVRYGSVGQPTSIMNLRLAADGEILVKTPAALKNYWGETDSGLFDEEGYLKTGDLGRIEDGYVYITGRKKEIIKTSTGQRISPSEIESNFKDILGIEQFVVIGNGRKYLTALVAMDESFTSQLLIANQDPTAYVQHEIEKRNVNLPGNRQVKKFAFLPGPLSIEAGELTTTLKVRRAEIEKRYQQLISTMYPAEEYL
ncbi:MAG: AMP-binding protein [Gammaproteobacteria bacterium]|nr:AMP-binding protein [Gammaproteobacteria bacterium]